MEPQDLYGLPLDQFTNQRNALAKELRREGRRDEAATVAKLRKPSVGAWAVNQLVRTQRGDVETLFEAGDALQRAQADLLAKRGDASALRQAVEAERAAAQRLADKARGLLDANGHELTSARLDQVTDTLHAAALDDDARARVGAGCLERELVHVGLGGLGATTTAKERKQPDRERDRGRDRADRQQRAADLKAARKDEAAARRELERASRTQRTAEQRREQAAAELSNAEEALAGARELADEAKRKLEQVQERIETL